MKENNFYEAFSEYLRQGEPDKRQKAENWRVAIGLQQVDGLTPSEYLVESAKRNIEGEVTVDEVKQLLKQYYESKTDRTPDDDGKEEADRVSTNIMGLLNRRTLAFSIVGLTSTHAAVFDGVFKHAGKIRDYDISKKEFVLKGSSVAYVQHEWIRRALEYDLQREHDFSYRGLSKNEIVSHLCRFTAGIWEIHPFCEGNTRTTSVFLIQYLRSMGFDINNDLFANHSWYFRNALVRANYSNPMQGIERDYSFLELFFRNLLLGEKNELKNRYMVINPPKELLPPDKIPDKIPDKPSDKSPDKSPDKFSTDNANIERLVRTIGSEELSVKEMLEKMGLKDRENFLVNFLNPSMSGGYVRMLYPKSPRHPRQKYLLTVKGIGLHAACGMQDAER